VLYECLTGQQPFPGNTLEQVAIGHLFTPPPSPSEKSRTLPTALDQVIATGLAKQPADRYPTAIEMAAAAKQVITEASRPHANRPIPAPVSAGSPGSTIWPQQAWAPPPADSHASQFAATPLSAPNLYVSPAPLNPKRPGRRHGVLVGALVFIVTLIAAGGVVAVVELTKDEEPSAGPPSAAASVGDFTGTYRADYGPGTDLEDKPVPNAPATTSNWAVRSTCGASGCAATAANVSGIGMALLSNLTFDQLGGAWVAVGLASAQCGDAPAEVWVVLTLQPHPDGTLSGETIRASTNGACAAKRTVKFTRTGDPDLNKVPDPAVLPPRSVTPADALRGSYRQTTTFANGNVVAGKTLTANTYCLRTGDRCMSLFHGPDGVVTLMFSDDKWTRNEQGTASCPAGGTAHVIITAEYPMPAQLDDPIALLTGRGSQSVAGGGACTGGGDFEDKFERTGD
jgi:hypothetical protein